MMKFLKLPILLLAIYLASMASMHLLSFAGRVKAVPYNKNGEGANILVYRKKMDMGEFPKGYAVFLAGTSRTMSDFSPTAMAREMESQLGGSERIRIFNIGNAAIDLNILNEHLTRDNSPRILVLEYHPKLITYPLADMPGGKRKSAWRESYESYLLFTKVVDLKLSGGLRRVFHLGDTIKVGPSTLSCIKQMLSGGGSGNPAKDFYYYQISLQGTGQRMRDDGQVWHRSYISGRNMGMDLRKWVTEYYQYKEQILVGGMREDSFDAYMRIVGRFAKDGRLIVVRPPLSPELYELENAMQAETTKRVVSYLESKGVPYIDMNPNDYYSTDMSHTDWYDTDALSRDLARRIMATTVARHEMHR